MLSSAITPVLDNFRLISIEEYAMVSNVMLKDRIEIYSSTEKERKNRLLSLGRHITDALTVEYKASFSYPLITMLEQLDFFLIFLDVIFNSTLVFLLMLSIMLVYALMVGGVDSKTYEYGMLRVLGLEQKNLITLLVIQAVTFSIPAICVALLVAYLLEVLVASILFQYCVASTNFGLTTFSIIMGVLIGTLIPLISNIMPIQRALFKTLRDALDLYHHIVSDLLVKIQKLEDMGLSMTQTVIAFTLIGCGVLAYYVAPYAIIYQDFRLFFMIMNIICICMIIGLVIIVQIFAPYLESLILSISMFICWKDRKLKSLISTNKKAHEKRNSKTSFMFAVALSFLVFAGSSFALQQLLIVDLIQMMFGADFRIMQMTGDIYGLKENELTKVLEAHKKTGDVVEYAFMSRELTHLLNSDASVAQPSFIFAPLCKSPDVNMDIYAVDKNYLKATMEEYYIPKDLEEGIHMPELKNGRKDVVYSLYTNESITHLSNTQYDPYGIINQQGLYYQNPVTNYPEIHGEEIKIIIPSGLKDPLSVTTKTKAFMCIGTRSDEKTFSCDVNYIYIYIYIYIERIQRKNPRTDPKDSRDVLQRVSTSTIFCDRYNKHAAILEHGARIL